MYNIENYRSRAINEQAVISKDYDERLKGYLENEDLLEVLSGALEPLENGSTTTTRELAIESKTYGILDSDVIHIEVDKSDENNPKFIMWIVNDEYVFDGVNMKTAAGLFNQSTKGDYGAVGTVGNYLGSLVGLGDAGDDGTDEEKLTGVAGALGAIAAEKRLDPKVYFDALASKVGNITGKLETEFSGRAEATALNLFRRPISSSWTRGTSLSSILGDIVLPIGTLGAGTAGSAIFKDGKVGGKTLTYSKGAGAVNKVSGIKVARRMKNAWKSLSGGTKVRKFKKAFPVGTEVKYVTKGGKQITAKVTEIFDDGGTAMVKLNNMTPVALENLVANAGKTGGLGLSSISVLVPNVSTKILVGAGVASVANKVEGSNVSMNPAELMGYYDSLTADPSSYIQNVKQQDSETLATMIMDLKQGTGFWGNTTDREELALALIITSLSPNGAKELQTEYEAIDPGNTVYSILDDELGGDMGLMAKVWWAALTGDGLENHPEINICKTAISK